MTHSDFSDLKDKKVILVGGFGLIGKALCKGFVNVKSNLIIVDINNNKSFLNKLNYHQRRVIFYSCDITKPKIVERLVTKIVKHHSEIDVFVNCSFPRTSDWLTGVETVPYNSVKTNLINHLGSYYHFTQLISKHMIKQKSGSIINFSSIYGLVAPTFSIYKGTNLISPPAYALIKGGINTMTKYFASYFGKYNIRVNCISPGGVFDNQDKKFVKKYIGLTPLKRMAAPEDLVMPTLFLASNGSRYITGHNLIVDAGWTAH